LLLDEEAAMTPNHKVGEQQKQQAQQQRSQKVSFLIVDSKLLLDEDEIKK
jgi:hypothetical protein